MIFTQTLRYGSKGGEVAELQKYLGITADGSFGIITVANVIALQKRLGVPADGIMGPKTRDALNSLIGTVLSEPEGHIALFCRAIQTYEGWSPGSRSYKNNNPGNLEFHHQPHAVLESVVTGRARFAKFDTYDHGFEALKDLITRALEGEMNVYSPTMSIKQFFDVYSPSNDGNDPDAYARFVAGQVGCSIFTQVKSLL